MFRIYPNMCNIIPSMNNFMHNQPMKNRQSLKLAKMSNTAYETDKESTSELGVCIALGVFIGWVNGMNDFITFK